MGLPPTPPPIRLLPPGRRASPLPAGAASLTIHGALLILVFAGSRHWRSPQPASSMMVQPNVLAFTYAAFVPPMQMPEDGSDDRPSSSPAPATRLTGSERSLLAGALSRLEPADLIPTTVTALKLRPTPLWPARMPSITLRPGGGPDGHAAGTRGQGSAPGLSARAGRGITRVAELIGKSGDACPVLPRPPGTGSDGPVAVAVTFVVDTVGVVDRATLRVVERPGEPPEPTGFIPHIYAVGATVRVDRNLTGAGAAYGTIVADDVLRHVAALRFRPGTRNGRPARSGVLVACQTG